MEVFCFFGQWPSETARGFKTDNASLIVAAGRQLIKYWLLETRRVQTHFPFFLRQWLYLRDRFF